MVDYYSNIAGSVDWARIRSVVSLDVENISARHRESRDVQAMRDKISRIAGRVVTVNQPAVILQLSSWVRFAGGEKPSTTSSNEPLDRTLRTSWTCLCWERTLMTS